MGYIDIHSHILSRMDDGSRSMQQSLKMLGIAYEEGIGLMFATLHMSGKGCYGKYQANTTVIKTMNN